MTASAPSVPCSAALLARRPAPSGIGRDKPLFQVGDCLSNGLPQRNLDVTLSNIPNARPICGILNSDLPGPCQISGNWPAGSVGGGDRYQESGLLPQGRR